MTEARSLASIVDGLRREHLSVADNFYSCPKSPDGCDDPEFGPNECRCGADRHNADVDAALALIEEAEANWYRHRCGGDA